MNEDTTTTNDNRATYCPEDNKLRLYVGRVPREEFLRLRAEGWTTLHKQRDAGGGDFVAIWTPDRRDTALEYAGVIEDEDMGPAERAADRAERFGGYRDKRLGEAVERADAYDERPGVFGFQSLARGEREVRRYDRMAAKACDSWRKADYWTRRTDGVIAHALYKSSPAVRMGRIKTIEADQRRILQQIDEIRERFSVWRKIAAIADPVKQTEIAKRYSPQASMGSAYKHPRTAVEGSIYELLTKDVDPITGAEAAMIWQAGNLDPDSPAFDASTLADWRDHYALRLAYENQMLQLQGGRAAFLEMEVGGWIGSEQIRKINRSPATGRVVSVQLLVETTGYTKESGYTQRATQKKLRAVNIERLSVDSYRAPTDEDKKALAATVAAEKAAEPKVAKPSLLNPTDEDADRLQEALNARARAKYAGRTFEPAKVIRTTQAIYSANARGYYSRAETRDLHADCELAARSSNMWSRAEENWRKRVGPALCKVRVSSASEFYTPDSIVVLTDKPRHRLPAGVFAALVAAPVENAPTAEAPAAEAGDEPTVAESVTETQQLSFSVS